jgi:four helix bundle protein
MLHGENDNTQMDFESWQQAVPVAIAHDALWKMKVYRLALFAADIGWSDITKLMGDRRTLAVADQLFRALGSEGANIAEGYSRGSGKDRVRFYEYALGSTRESRDWYYTARHVLGDKVTSHRISLQSEIIRLLLTMIPEQRTISFRESELDYDTTIASLLTSVPMS